ncbi:MFS transporter [Nocardia sp. IFM 10818]
MLFWFADSVSMFGTYVTAQALQLLAVLTLGASAFELGILRAAHWLPYLLFGLLAGVFVDRCRRKPILVGADLARAVLLALIPLLVLTQVLTVRILIVLVLAVGLVSLVYDAAHRSFLPGLVPRSLLVQANARLEQSAAVAQVGGQVIPLAHSGTAGFTLLCAAQFVFWLSVGIDSPLEMSYQQSITPDRLLGRTSATIRSLNRGAIVIGAPLGGLLAAWAGTRAALWTAVAGLVLAALSLTVSGFRHVRLDHAAT